MNAGRTIRERARAELTREIKEAARRQLAAEGAQRLSVRAVARELGMVSSALYRYFPSRDDLLTALIVDAYDALGASAEAAAGAGRSSDAGQPASADTSSGTEAAASTGTSSGAGLAGHAEASGDGQADDVRGRWRAACHAVRAWAIAHPHEYALIYGSPVPGYQAPQETVGPASRVAIVVGRLIREAWEAGSPGMIAGRSPAAVLPATLAEQAARVAAEIAPGVPEAVIARGLIAWTQLFGMISFELFGQFVGSVDPTGEFFAFAVEQMADFVGFPAALAGSQSAAASQSA